MGSQWSQIFPPKPSFTMSDIGPQDGRVFIVTGGYSGIGQEISKQLYLKNSRVYIAGRSKERADQAIAAIRDTTSSGGSLEFLHLELDDLTTIKESVESFKAKESALHVLWNNAGVSQPPLESVSKQGIELQLATNCLGPFLFTSLLLPLLQATAEQETVPASTRVIWSSSQMIELSTPPQGLIMNELDVPPKDKTRRYVNSKTGNIFLSSELARRQGASGVISLATNPGAVRSNLFRHTPWLPYLSWPLLHKVELGALTQLFAGLSDEIRIETNGGYIIPWGRVAKGIRENLQNAIKPKDQGGSGVAEEFWRFCEEKTRDYA